MVPARAGLPYLSNMRSAITGRVRPSATSFEAALSTSARTGPPPKCTVRSPCQTTWPSRSSTRATKRLSPSTRLTARQRLSATVLASLSVTPSKLSGSTGAPLMVSSTVWPGSCWIAILIEAMAATESASGVSQRMPGVRLSTSMTLRGAELSGCTVLCRLEAATLPGPRSTTPGVASFCGSPPACRELQRRVRLEARAFDDDVDAAIGGEAGRVLAVVQRLVGAATFDLHARRRHVERDGQVVGHRLRARARQRVVVGEHAAVAPGDRLRVGMTDGADGDVARAAPAYRSGCAAPPRRTAAARS